MTLWITRCVSRRSRFLIGFPCDAHRMGRGKLYFCRAVGSGRQTREVVADPALMARLRLDPSRQLLGAQCSGTLILAKLGLLDGVPACTDLITKPWVEEAGVCVLNQPFVAKGNVATAGGCLASQYLAAWMIARLEGIEAAKSAMHYVAPVGEKDEYFLQEVQTR
ncbi:hypothetical protein VAR608DRAFT_2078 [Variovorax sp. HW608]|nr:hypothetical protein VAR608DRAFT_2078 [Variovorax sp. HW608]